VGYQNNTFSLENIMLQMVCWRALKIYGGYGGFKIKFIYPNGPSKPYLWPELDDICWVTIGNCLYKAVTNSMLIFLSTFVIYRVVHLKVSRTRAVFY
jgi:hypothetical protein